MRILTGARKGLSIPLPKGLTIRPTLGRVKEALFDILSTRIYESTFLDLYAGTGSIGLEAHSRGASKVIFVEQNRKTSALLRRNVDRYCESMPPKYRLAIRIHTKKVEGFLMDTQHSTTPADIIFADPPYDNPFSPTLMNHITRSHWLHPDGILIVEHRFNHTMGEIAGNISKCKTYRYGDSALSIYEPTTTPSMNEGL